MLRVEGVCSRYPTNVENATPLKWNKDYVTLPYIIFEPPKLSSIMPGTGGLGLSSVNPRAYFLLREITKVT